MESTAPPPRPPPPPPLRRVLDVQLDTMWVAQWAEADGGADVPTAESESGGDESSPLQTGPPLSAVAAARAADTDKSIADPAAAVAPLVDAWFRSVFERRLVGVQRRLDALRQRLRQERAILALRAACEATPTPPPRPPSPLLSCPLSASVCARPPSRRPKPPPATPPSVAPTEKAHPLPQRPPSPCMPSDIRGYLTPRSPPHHHQPSSNKTPSAVAMDYVSPASPRTPSIRLPALDITRNSTLRSPIQRFQESSKSYTPIPVRCPPDKARQPPLITYPSLSPPAINEEPPRPPLLCRISSSAPSLITSTEHASSPAQMPPLEASPFAPFITRNLQPPESPAHNLGSTPPLITLKEHASSPVQTASPQLSTYITRHLFSSPSSPRQHLPPRPMPITIPDYAHLQTPTWRLNATRHGPAWTSPPGAALRPSSAPQPPSVGPATGDGDHDDSFRMALRHAAGIFAREAERLRAAQRLMSEMADERERQRAVLEEAIAY